MLEHIHIENFAIIENLQLDLSMGMTVITGDTGAGKSIVIDALDIALGHRADSKFIREGATRCEINATFDISACKQAKLWLQENDLLIEEATCIIRRVITIDGRSKNYINGRSVTVQQLRLLAEELIQIHAQHEHYALLKREEQRNIVDRFANHADLLAAVAHAYQTWRQAYEAWQTLLTMNTNDRGKIDLLSYQLQELTALNLQNEELEQLHQEQKKLTHAQDLSVALANAVESLDENILALLTRNSRDLMPYQKILPELTNIITLLENATVNLEEAKTELNALLTNTELNPKRLQHVEDRLQTIYQLARKLHVPAENLLELKQQLTQQLEDLQHIDEKLAQLEKRRIASEENISASCSCTNRIARKSGSKNGCAHEHLFTAIKFAAWTIQRGIW